MARAETINIQTLTANKRLLHAYYIAYPRNPPTYPACAAGRKKSRTHADFLTANEGDAREYGEEDTPEFFTDETRVADLAVELGLDATTAPYSDDALGRLKVSR